MTKSKVLIFLGLILLASQMSIAWLSRFFIFGQSHAERPIILFLILEFLAFAAYFFAVEWVRKRFSPENIQPGYFAWILFIGILCRLVFLPSQLIQETDPYRYIWDGQTMLLGENPYQYSPEEAFENQAILASNHQEEAAEIFQKINHSGVKTIYPPLAQYLFAISQTLTPWQLMSWRLMILFAEFSILALMLGILLKLGMKKEWLVLYAWCPLVIKEFSNSLHLDVFAVFFLTLMIFALLRQRYYLGFISLAFAAGIKLFPLVLTPLVFLWISKINRKTAWLGLGIFAVLLLILYLPFMSAGASVFEGLVRFAGAWKVNEGLFALIRLGLAEPASRIAAGLLFVTCLMAATKIINHQTEVQRFFQGCLFVIAGLFFLAPTGNPWYFTWVFPFLYFQPLRSLLIFSGLVFLYYLDFYFSYRSQSQYFIWAKWIEYGIFYSVLAMELLWKKQKSLSFYRLQTSANLSAAR